MNKNTARELARKFVADCSGPLAPFQLSALFDRICSFLMSCGSRAEVEPDFCPTALRGLNVKERRLGQCKRSEGHVWQKEQTVARPPG